MVRKSAKETLRNKRRERFVASGHSTEGLKEREYSRDLKILAPATEYNYEAILRMWREFLETVMEWDDERIIQSLANGALFPSTDLARKFFEWWAAASLGKKTEKVSVRSALITFERWNAAIRHVTGTSAPEHASRDIRAFIENTLAKTHGLFDTRPTRKFADEVDYKTIIQQAWCYDADEIRWDRDRIQFTFMVQIMYYTDGRPGQFLPNMYYPALYLPYKHLQFRIMRINGGETFTIELSEEFRKGQKDEHHNKVSLLWAEEAEFIFCPISKFLALAFADDVFRDVRCPEDLLQLHLQPGENARHIPYRPEKENLPILKSPSWTLERHNRWMQGCLENAKKRRKAQEAGVSALLDFAEEDHRLDFASPLFTAARFRDLLKSVTLRAGYSHHITPYHIRKGIGNKLNESKEVTNAQFGQIMGHQEANQRTFMTNYQDPRPAVDMASLVQQRPSRVGWANAINTLRRVPRIEPMPPQLPLQYLPWEKLKQARTASEKTAIHRRAHIKAREHWRSVAIPLQQHQQPPHVESDLSLSAIPNSSERFGDLNKAQTRASIVFSTDPCRLLICELCRNTNYDLRDQSVLHALISLASRAPPQLNYSLAEPQQSPHGDSCPDCQKPLKNCKPVAANDHLFSCAKQRLARPELEGWMPRYCYRCSEWFTDGGLWRRHCGDHFKELDKFCGYLTIRGTHVAVGRCPYCLSHAEDGKAPFGEWETVVQEFESPYYFRRHLLAHFQRLEIKELYACPHPKCPDTEPLQPRALLCHFTDAHGLNATMLRDLMHPIWDLESIDEGPSTSDMLSPDLTSNEQTAEGPFVTLRRHDNRRQQHGQSRDSSTPNRSDSPDIRKQSTKSPKQQMCGPSGTARLYTCNKRCEKIFTSMSGLRDHERLCGDPWICPDCNKPLHSQTGIEYHQLSHERKCQQHGQPKHSSTLNRSHAPDISDQLETSPKQQARSPNGTALYTCSKMCVKTFAWPAALRNHESLCGNPWICPDCNKPLHSKNGIEYHKKRSCEKIKSAQKETSKSSSSLESDQTSQTVSRGTKRIEPDQRFEPEAAKRQRLECTSSSGKCPSISSAVVPRGASSPGSERDGHHDVPVSEQSKQTPCDQTILTEKEARIKAARERMAAKKRMFKMGIM